MSTRFWLITGDPGIGKTSVLVKLLAILRARDYSVGGVLSREQRRGGDRVGFEMIDVATGSKDILASSTLCVGPRMGRYRVNLKGLSELGAKSLIKAVDFADIIVCDEIGPMEMFSPEFRRAVKVVAASRKPVIGIIHKKLRDPIVNELRSWPGVEIFEVTLGNRDNLPSLLAEEVLKVMGE